MNSAANAAVSLVERYYAAFNAGDINTMLGLLSDEVLHDINQGRREVGRAAFHSFMERMNSCYRERVADLTILANIEGKRAAAEFIVYGTYLKADGHGAPPANGQKYVIPVGAFFEIEAGRITRVTNYYNVQDWLKQVRET